ncbi:hypothetical protein Acr_24g0011630 [Actinidia rufa]|uniref:Uncharacterized protein n=1 Tax=Actinidia rufa TaxID=165716 RepID=A0A7J0GW07_9ERIC|nr:hypothetical protein Acr_24g0011630 [Actinidia rufa]
MATTSSDVTEHGGVHEKETLPPTGKGKRGESTDIMSSLETRLQRVELAMADNRDKAQLDALKDSLQAEIAAIREEIKEVKGDWSLCKMAITQAKLEVQRRGPQDLATTISIVESLTDFKKGESFSSKPKFQKSNQGKGGGDNVGQLKEGGHKLSSSSHSRFNKDKRSGDKPNLTSFLCDGNHFARDCPKQAKLSALIQDDEEKPHQEETKMGSLQLFNAIKATVDLTKGRGRMYVEAKVRSFDTHALVDTGASRNFIEVKEAKRLGLQFKEEQGWLKAVNSEARPIYGVARDVQLHIGDWCGQVDFLVVPMDDYLQLENVPLDICSIKLDGTNYLIWSRTFTLAIEARGMSEFIKEPDTQSEETVALKKFKSQKSLVMTWLFNSMRVDIRHTFLLLDPHTKFGPQQNRLILSRMLGRVPFLSLGEVYAIVQQERCYVADSSLRSFCLDYHSTRDYSHVGSYMVILLVGEGVDVVVMVEGEHRQEEDMFLGEGEKLFYDHGDRRKEKSGEEPISPERVTRDIGGDKETSPRSNLKAYARRYSLMQMLESRSHELRCPRIKPVSSSKDDHSMKLVTGSEDEEVVLAGEG